MTSDPIRKLFTLLVFTFISYFVDPCYARSDAYSDVFKLTRNTVDNSDYNKDMRPLLNQSHVMTVIFSFAVVSLDSVDDVTQSCAINGFLTLTWMDELLRWNASDYGGFSELQTQSSKLWHPLLTLINVVGERENIEEEANPLLIRHTGNVTWVSGAIFSVACHLDVRKFPFDAQTCELFFCPMGYFSDKLVFVPAVNEVNKVYFYSNKAWDMLRTSITIPELAMESGVLSCPIVTFYLKRRPNPFLYNVLAPTLMLSFLNLLVFIIPAESGEKISYGITVLLSITVYLGQVVSMLPHNSDEVPTVTVYLFFLLLNSVLCVVASILTVFLHHSNESKREDKQDINYTVNQYSPRITTNRVNPTASEIDSKVTGPPGTNKLNELTKKNREQACLWIKKHINRISFALLFTYWFALTLWYFFDVTI